MNWKKESRAETIEIALGGRLGECENEEEFLESDVLEV